ncbi:hypothetical protein K435DRAFT_849686 [Dendrothele bispora CBS 962.96]|uniref:Uncharacterized protein n=1 Tax=Dendrothele bispora (strain CBS 962.96) TaxID=1314807 RepID=A0A4S8MSQ6_DENBC|nr:hypothetical protein K435DRAFT_849686 [Dendrothele bispora CBS 962.96]
MGAHGKGVDFYPGADKLYLVTTGDDKSVKVYLSSPLSLKVVSSNLNRGRSHQHDRIKNTLSYALERALLASFLRARHHHALRKDANEVAVGYDKDVVVI